MRRLARGFGFLLIPLIGVVTPLLALPAISIRFGAAGWAAVAIAQSVGTAAGTLVELGWGLNGPQSVARKGAASSYQFAVLSLQAKLLVFLPVAAGAWAVTFLLVPTYEKEAAVAAIGTTLTSVGLVWFFLGKSKPWLVVLTEGVPRVVGIAAASILLLLGSPLWVYGVVGLIAPSVVSIVLGYSIIRSGLGTRPRSLPLRVVLRTIRFQVPAVIARGGNTVYSALPIALVSIAAPQGVAVFAAGERLMRFALTGIFPLLQAVQGWVGSARSKDARWRRAYRALIINVLGGLLAATAFGLVAPLAAEILFASVIELPPELAWAFSVVIMIVATSRATGGIVLVAMGRIRVIAVSTVLAASVAAPALLVLPRFFGPLGGVMAEVLAESVVLLVQLAALRRRARPVVV